MLLICNKSNSTRTVLKNVSEAYKWKIIATKPWQSVLREHTHTHTCMHTYIKAPQSNGDMRVISRRPEAEARPHHFRTRSYTLRTLEILTATETSNPCAHAHSCRQAPKLSVSRYVPATCCLRPVARGPTDKVTYILDIYLLQQ